jgi:hypothetical protein
MFDMTYHVIFKHFHFWYFRGNNSSGVEFKLEHIHETDSKWSLDMVINYTGPKNSTKPIRVSQYDIYFVDITKTVNNKNVSITLVMKNGENNREKRVV